MSSVAWNATGSIYSADCRVKRPSPLRFVMNLNDLDGFEENTLPFPHTVKQVVWDMMQESSDEGEPTKMDLDDKEPIEIYLDDEEPTAIDSNREESDTKMPLAVISLVRYPSIQPDIEDIDSPASAHKMATSKLLHLAQKAIRMVNFRRSVPGWPTVFLLQKSFSLGRSNRDPKTAPVLQLHFDLHKVIKRMGGKKMKPRVCYCLRCWLTNCA